MKDDTFGKVGEGIHSYRVFNLAIIDVLFTILGSYFISYIFDISFLTVLIVIFLIGIILHRKFNVKTTIDKLIFGN